MQEALLSPLATWQNFYVLIGTAAATLTGLLFVAVTLIAGRRVRVPSQSEVFAAFSTPIVFHFGAALFVAAILSAPWQALWPAARPLRSRGSDLRRHRGTADTPSDGLSTGAGRLAVAYDFSPGLLHRLRRRSNPAARLSGTGTVRHRRGSGAAAVHRHPQRLGWCTNVAIELSKPENKRQDQ